MENQITQNPTSESALTPIQNSEPKTKFPIMYLVLSLLVLIFLASTAFLYYQNMQLKNILASYQNAASSTPTASQSPAPTTDPTTNWKTYKNSQYAYMVDYPNSWEIENNCVGSSASADYVCLKSPDLKLSPVPNVESGILVSIYGKSDGSLGIGYTTNKFCQPGDSTTPVKNCRETTIGEQRVFVRDFGSFRDYGFVKNGLIFLTIRADFAHNQPTNNDHVQLVDQILSTFKFTN